MKSISKNGKIVVSGLAILCCAFLLFSGSVFSAEEKELTFNPKIRKIGRWIICPEKKVHGKGLNPELINQRICILYKKAAKEVGYVKAKYILGLVDWESGGTWDPNIRGDHGCSKGIAQWNRCVKRIAPEGFEAQADLIVKEMKQKFDLHPINLSICLHNSPVGRCGRSYVQKVLQATQQFL